MSEKIEILLSDDEKTKIVGEMLTNDSSRKILQLLFSEELSANDISQRTGISLQLVKYHLEKMQRVGMVKISKTEKNSKGRDMKFYRATKFAIVIVPSKVSHRARQSKSLVRSFQTIYKFAGVGAAAVAGLFSLSLLQDVIRRDPAQDQYVWNSAESPQEGVPYMSDSVLDNEESVIEGQSGANMEPYEIIPGFTIFDGNWILGVIVVAITGGLAAYLFWKSRRLASRFESV